jgi:drug/metabolite transporter (DMT)-like permease
VRTNAWIPIIAATIGFATGTVAAKDLLDSGVSVWTAFPPRFVIGTVAVFAGLPLFGRVRAPNTREWLMGLVIGLLNMTVSTAFLYLATERLSGSAISLLIGLIPLATVGAAHLLVPGERASIRGLPGFVIALVGVAVLAAGDLGGGGELVGLAWAIAGVTTAGAGGALTRRFARSTSAGALIVPQFVAGTVAACLVAVPFSGYTQLTTLSVGQWADLLALGVVGTGVAFLGLLRASEIAPAAKVALVGYLVPVAGAMGSIVFLGERPTVALLVGGTLLMIGVVVAERSTIATGGAASPTDHEA